MNERPYSQVVVWPGTIVGASEAEAFVAWIAEAFNGTRAVYLEDVTTNPDLNDDGSPVPGTGGRIDAFFAVHEDDIPKFAVARLRYGMQWIDDVYWHHNDHRYPSSVLKYRSWDPMPSTAELDEYLEDGSETGCVGD